MRRRKSPLIARSRRERKEALGLTQEIVDVLNYKKGDPCPGDRWAEFMVQVPAEAEEGPGMELEELRPSLSDEPLEIDPDARPFPPDRESMLECQPPLREFIDAWLEAKCDVSRWRFRAELEAALSRRRTHFCTLKDGRPAWYLDSPATPPPRGHDPNGYTDAVRYMFEFITSSRYRDIGRCARCRDYFVATRGSGRKQFCSQRCAKADSATKATAMRRQEERNRKLEAIKAAVAKLCGMSAETRKRKLRREPWRAYVLREAKELWSAGEHEEIRQNFLTRAINKGDLRVPETLIEQKRPTSAQRRVT